MAIEVPRSLIEFILLGPEDDRRQLQDSPILGDVWVEFAKKPGERLELLITPYKEQAAGTVAYELSQCQEIRDADIAYLQGIVAAKLSFEEVLRFIVPMTYWWNDKRISGAIRDYTKKPKTMETTYCRQPRSGGMDKARLRCRISRLARDISRYRD